MSAKRRICVVTGTRAEYGLLYWLMRHLRDDPEVQLQVLACAAHLSPEFGMTVHEIERDGFVVDASVEMLLSSDTPTGIIKSMGVGLIGFADALARLKPDMIVLLGDRFEALAAAEAALIARVPIAHLHGGEVSEGAYDESIRHAITKLSQWHFVAAEAYRRRVIQLGEAPERVFNFGAPGLDHLAQTPLLDRTELEQSLGLPLGRPVLLVTYHPETLGAARPADAMRELLAALDAFPDATIVLSYPNADTGGRALFPLIDGFVAADPQRRKAFVALGHRRYLSLMKEADAVVGNSSSGLTEAPALHRATVNVGDRQKGRLRAESVIDVAADRASIEHGLRQALSPAFQARLPQVQSPYGQGDASRRIVEQLKKVELGAGKRFFDIPFQA